MSKLPSYLRPSLHSVFFELQLETFWDSYVAADEALQVKLATAEDTIRRRFGMGPEDVFEYPDDPEYSGPDFGEEVGDEERRAEEARQVLRPAFLIGLYHLWERHAARWTKLHGKDFEFKKATRIIRQTNPNLPFDELNEVRLAANCAKHGPGPSGEDLFDLRPDLFKSGTSRDEAGVDTLLVTPELLRKYRWILVRSVPRGPLPGGDETDDEIDTHE